MPSGTSRSSPSTAVIGPKRLDHAAELDRRHRTDAVMVGLVVGDGQPWKTAAVLDERWIRSLHVESMRRGRPARRARAARPLPGLDDRRPARRRLRRRPQLRRAGRARRPRARHAEPPRRRDDRPRRRASSAPTSTATSAAVAAGGADAVRGRHPLRADDRRATLEGRARPRRAAGRARRADPGRRLLLRDPPRRPLRARSAPARSRARSRPTGR